MGSTESMTNQGAAADLAATPNTSTTNTPANSGLMGSVGIGGDNHPDDVLRVSSTLHANGLFEDGPTEQPEASADASPDVARAIHRQNVEARAEARDRGHQATPGGGRGGVGRSTERRASSSFETALRASSG